MDNSWRRNILEHQIDGGLYARQGKAVTNFSEFVGGALEIFDDPLMSVCSAQIPEIIKNVSPDDIINHCGNKIVWPYSDKSLLKSEIWEAWLLYLIIRCIEDHDNLKDENYYMIKDKDKDRQVKMLYSAKHIKLPDFLKDYLQNAYQDVRNGELVIIKTDKIPTKKILPSRKIDEIVMDISNVISIENNLYIDDVKSTIQHISLVHIRALVDEMANFVEEEENEGLVGRALERKLSGRIMEVLHGI